MPSIQLTTGTAKPYPWPRGAGVPSRGIAATAGRGAVATTGVAPEESHESL